MQAKTRRRLRRAARPACTGGVRGAQLLCRRKAKVARAVRVAAEKVGLELSTQRCDHLHVALDVVVCRAHEGDYGLQLREDGDHSHAREHGRRPSELLRSPLEMTRPRRRLHSPLEAEVLS
eukprot:6174299-Pleurochrysis_carterae.AAC.2